MNLQCICLCSSVYLSLIRKHISSLHCPHQTAPLPSVALSAVGLTNKDLPFPIGVCHLISTAHLAKGHASDDEDDEAGSSAVLARSLILVPVAVPGTARAER